MGGDRSSSKRKSSKRKSSKLSSEARRKKRSRTKSKKLRHDSFSDSSDSSSSVSISSSSSEDDYRRARSRTRSEVKGSSRKRTRRSSSSEEKSRNVKKRKGSKRSANSDSKKKYQKKKRKREPTAGSINSDSRSCSTCRDGSSSSGDSQFERHRARSREKRKEKRLSKAKGATKSYKNRSRSCSPSARVSDRGDHNSNDVLPVETHVRRLRSVITVPKSAEGEDQEWEKDGHKEEIAYDHDDYPSCRSNDSNEGGSKTEIASLDLQSKRVENVEGGEALVSDIGMTENTKTCVEGGVQDSQSKSLSDGSGANIYNKETKVDVFPTISGANGDDLESVLRLKALENLKKYRGVRLQTNAKPPTDEKTKSGSEVKRLSTAKVEFVQNNSTNEDDSRVVDATRGIDENRRSKMGRDSSFPATSYGKGQDGQGIGTERGIARRSLISLPNKVAISGNSKNEDPYLASDSELVKSALRQEASEAIPHKANMLVTQSGAEKRSVETSKSVGQMGGDNDGVDDVGESSISKPLSSSSSLKPTLEEQNSKDQQGGQFEQKTMSVMRGGEMVEVSYKVYIPKKAPALARRHLRR